MIKEFDGPKGIRCAFPEGGRLFITLRRTSKTPGSGEAYSYCLQERASKDNITPTSRRNTIVLCVGDICDSAECE
jgi:hypothetical protein